MLLFLGTAWHLIYVSYGFSFFDHASHVSHVLFPVYARV